MATAGPGDDTVGRRTVSHPQDRGTAGPVRRADVLHQLPRPHRHLVRGPQRHERGPRPDRRAVRPGVGHLLHRLHRAGDPEQHRAAQVRRPQVAGPHHGVLGPRVAGVHLRPERRGPLLPPRAARRRRSRLLPRRDPVPEPVGARPLPQQGAGPVLRRPAADDRHRRTAGRRADLRRRRLRPRRLALHVPVRLAARDPDRHRGLVLPDRQAGRRQMADRRREVVADR